MINLDILNPEWNKRKSSVETIEKQYKPGLVRKKVKVHREGTIFDRWQWVRPDKLHSEEALDWASEVIDFNSEKEEMEETLDKVRYKSSIKRTSGVRNNQSMSLVKEQIRKHIDSYEEYLDAYTFNRLNEAANRVVDSCWNLSGDFDAGDVQELAIKSVDKLMYQELRSWERQLGDHGVRHIIGNMRLTGDILDELSRNEFGITDRDRFLANIVMINHDLGYTSKYCRQGFENTKQHKEISLALFNNDILEYKKFFSDDDLGRIENYILVHDAPFLEWNSDPILSTISVSDNLSLYYKDKLPALFGKLESGVGLLIEMQKALNKDDTEHFESLKRELFSEIDRSKLPEFTKRSLKKAASEVGPITPKVTVPMLIGDIDKVNFEKDRGLEVYINQNESAQRLHDIFDMGQDKVKKFCKDYGVDPEGKSEIDLPGLHIHIKDVLEKAKIYLRQGEEPPKGHGIKTGRRGGKYYETEPERTERTRVGYKIPFGGEAYKDVDEGIIDDVVKMNELGFLTYASCEGHIEDEETLESYVASWPKMLDEEKAVNTLLENGFKPLERLGWEERDKDPSWYKYKIGKPTWEFGHDEFSQEWIFEDNDKYITVNMKKPQEQSFIRSFAFYTYPKKNKKTKGDDLSIDNIFPMEFEIKNISQDEWDNIRDKAYDFMIDDILSELSFGKIEKQEGGALTTSATFTPTFGGGGTKEIKIYDVVEGKKDKINKLKDEQEIHKFLKGYERIANGLAYDDEINILLKSVPGGEEWLNSDRITKVIEIDRYAHDLHQLKKYSILDKIAEKTKDIETDRADRLILLQNEGAKDKLAILHGGMDVLQKSWVFEEGSYFWGLFEKSIKEGIGNFTDEQIVHLREWLFARV